ncbi:MAG TPA: metallophosphoesterase [Candidatus Polarisedimenticolaceae bacterium]|nr:metallophosphoesterase [Candidatus Polarisedimenticolaceae bacterium]
MSVRIAAVGDIHIGTDGDAPWSQWLGNLRAEADLFLLAGDLTRAGRMEEARRFVEEMGALNVPVVTVLGNHDYHSGHVDEIVRLLEGAGIRVLEGDSLLVDVAGRRVGIAGTKGFGGGFAGACGSDFGEPEMKAFIGHTRALAGRLKESLRKLEADLRIALLHYSPIPETLEGERREIYPFLGSYLLAEAADGGGADLVLHGHAHAGSEAGETPGGIPVRNVAQPVIRRPYKVYSFG